MQKLKILYHHRVAAQDGQSVHIKELTDNLKSLGHEIIFVGPSLRPSELGSENKALSLIRRVLPKPAQELLEVLYSYRAYSKLKAAYKEHKPDVLYERYNLFLTAGARLKKKTGIPYIVEVNAPLTDERAKYGGLFFQSLAKQMEETTWQSADMNLPVTRVLADILVEHGVKEDTLTVIHNGINPEDYEADSGAVIRSKLGIGDALLLGFTGFLREWHRLDRVIEIVSAIPEETRPHLLIVGEGPAIDTCKQLSADLKVTDYIHFVGLIGRKDIPAYVSAMDISLQPAVTSYASPLKIFEYMAAGTAIIAPDQPNIREILTDGKDALLFDPYAEDGPANAIKALLENEELRNKLGEAAKATITKRGFTWLGNARTVAKLATSLLAKKQV